MSEDTFAGRNALFSFNCFYSRRKGKWVGFSLQKRNNWFDKFVFYVYKTLKHES